MPNCVSVKITSRSWLGEGIKFGKLIIRKIIDIVATSCQILTIKCTKIDFGWGSAPDPARRPYIAPAQTV